jgi:hypothetical protein
VAPRLAATRLNPRRRHDDQQLAFSARRNQQTKS